MADKQRWLKQKALPSVWGQNPNARGLGLSWPEDLWGKSPLVIEPQFSQWNQLVEKINVIVSVPDIQC
jgi:hypothetical protein